VSADVSELFQSFSYFSHSGESHLLIAWRTKIE